MSGGLLRPHDPPTVSLVNPQGRSPFLLIGDHAGRAIPEALADLGVSSEDRARHIAVDIGISALGHALSGRLDAVFIAQHWSRLVIDCNRDPGSDAAVPTVSDGTIIPGNRDLSPQARAARVDEIHGPYQQAVAEAIAARMAEPRPTVLVSLHSFTPRLAGGEPRPWDAGVLHDGGDPRFALAMLERMRHANGLAIGDNEPYRMDSVDHTVPRHAYAARLPYVELEVRQDHLANGRGVMEWADRLCQWLEQAWSDIQ